MLKKVILAATITVVALAQNPRVRAVVRQPASYRCGGRGGRWQQLPVERAEPLSGGLSATTRLASRSMSSSSESPPTPIGSR